MLLVLYVDDQNRSRLMAPRLMSVPNFRVGFDLWINISEVILICGRQTHKNVFLYFKPLMLVLPFAFFRSVFCGRFKRPGTFPPFRSVRHLWCKHWCQFRAISQDSRWRGDWKLRAGATPLRIYVGNTFIPWAAVVMMVVFTASVGLPLLLLLLLFLFLFLCPSTLSSAYSFSIKSSLNKTEKKCIFCALYALHDVWRNSYRYS